MGDQEKREPARKAALSLYGLAIRIARGQITLDEALELVRQAEYPPDEGRTSDA